MAYHDPRAGGLAVRLGQVELRAGFGAHVEAPSPPVAPAPAQPAAIDHLDCIAAAFDTCPPSDIEARLLHALLRRPGATSAELSAACGWPRPIWHTHFRLLCQRREQWLWPIAPAGADGAPFIAGALADYDPEGGRFTLRPEAAEVLKSHGVER